MKDKFYFWLVVFINGALFFFVIFLLFQNYKYRERLLKEFSYSKCLEARVVLAKERFENITIQDIDGNIIDFSYTPNKKSFSLFHR